jgi:hypothetical protein
VQQTRCLGCSGDEKIIYLGGGEDTATGKPCLAAVSFDSKLTVIAEAEFDFAGLSMVYSLKT